MQPIDRLEAGEVGYIVTGIKDVSEVQVGDTFTHVRGGATEPLPGYLDVKPMVFAGLFPTDADDYQDLRDALEKLSLNDASLVYEPETSQALGFGFRCGFLGLLHMDVVRERLEREFDLDLLVTTPNVAYEVADDAGAQSRCTTRRRCPTRTRSSRRREPYVKASLIVPKEYVGTVMELAPGPPRRVRPHGVPLADARAAHLRAAAGRDRARLLRPAQEPHARATPRSTTSSRASARPNLVKLDILLNGESGRRALPDRAPRQGLRRGQGARRPAARLIPRQIFDVPIQASIGSRIIARETVKAKRKDVLAKCYGGDVTRKRKLLEKQKKGKKRMKIIGTVEVPQEAFLAVLSLDGEGARRSSACDRASRSSATSSGCEHARLHEPLERGAILQLHDTFEEPGGRRRRGGARAAGARRRDALLHGARQTTRRGAESERVLRADGCDLRVARRAGPQNRVTTVAEPGGERTILVHGANDASDDRRSARLGRAGGLRRRLLHRRRSRARSSPRARARVARGDRAAARERGREPRAGRRAGGLGARSRRALRPGRSARAPAAVRLDRGRRRRPLPAPRTAARAAGRPCRPPGPIVDTYGAGDVFMAALTLELGARRGRDEALALAARASAAQLTRRGGGPS